MSMKCDHGNDDRCTIPPCGLVAHLVKAKLALCPFCGGVAETVTSTVDDAFYGYIGCSNDDCAMVVLSEFDDEDGSHEQAIERWNDRRD